MSTLDQEDFDEMFMRRKNILRTRLSLKKFFVHESHAPRFLSLQDLSTRRGGGAGDRKPRIEMPQKGFLKMVSAAILGFRQLPEQISV